MDDLKWLLERKSKVHQVDVAGRAFYLREPTVSDRDRFDALVARMNLDSARMRTPLLQATISNADGEPIARDEDFDSVPAELVEPLIDKARQLFGLSEIPTEDASS